MSNEGSTQQQQHEEDNHDPNPIVWFCTLVLVQGFLAVVYGSIIGALLYLFAICLNLITATFTDPLLSDNFWYYGIFAAALVLIILNTKLLQGDKIDKQNKKSASEQLQEIRDREKISNDKNYGNRK